ncbi:MAG: hypothetical protein KBG20_15840 [Caldilineaceae bacterium]|nr:hypothetical protein [Caldilineaceae bacterium]MBP8124957.1 hypothetical protein [Caldilineaceae bacterium]MBP9073779.1 hypothetical protein [Caldilineaceae bacterium]
MTKRTIFYHLDQWAQERQLADTADKAATVRPARRWLPTPGNMIFTLVLVFTLLWAQNVGALNLGAATAGTSTSTIAYQGRLADSDGTPLTDTLNMSFRLYGQVSGGVALWTEQWTGSNGVQVSDGLFNVMLGSLDPIPQNIIITSNDNLFLGITVGTDGEMSPRVQLGSVPFAVQALTVPDGSITSQKMSPILESVLAADAELTGVPQTIASATIAVEVPSKIWITATCDCEYSTTTSGLIAGEIYVDEVLVPGAIFHGVYQPSGVMGRMRSSVSRSYVYNLDPGTHILDFRVKMIDGVGSGHAYAGHSGFTYLVVAR